MPRFSGCENFSPGTFEKQAPRLETRSLRSGEERSNHEVIGPPQYESFFIAFVKELFHNAVEIDILGIFEGYSSLPGARENTLRRLAHFLC